MKKANIARKIAATSTFSSWKRIPHVSFVCDIDVSPLYEKYQKLKENLRGNELRISLNTIIVKIIAESIKPYQVLYSSFSYNRLIHKMKYEYYETVDINIPWILPTGEMIPFLLKNVANKSLSQVAFEIDNIKKSIEDMNIENEMVTAAINDTKKKLRKFDLSVVTRIIPLKVVKAMTGYKKNNDQNRPEINSNGIIISNVGSLLGDINGRFALLEIIEPKIIAIGISSIEDKIILTEKPEKYGIKKILPLTIAFDHRAIDFGNIVPFIKNIREKASTYEIET